MRLGYLLDKQTVIGQVPINLLDQHLQRFDLSFEKIKSFGLVPIQGFVRDIYHGDIGNCSLLRLAIHDPKVVRGDQFNEFLISQGLSIGNLNVNDQPTTQQFVQSDPLLKYQTLGGTVEIFNLRRFPTHLFSSDMVALKVSEANEETVPIVSFLPTTHKMLTVFMEAFKEKQALFTVRDVHPDLVAHLLELLNNGWRLALNKHTRMILPKLLTYKELLESEVFRKRLTGLMSSSLTSQNQQFREETAFFIKALTQGLTIPSRLLGLHLVQLWRENLAKEIRNI